MNSDPVDRVVPHSNSGCVMRDWLSAFDPYLLRGEVIDEFDKKFKRVLHDVDFGRCPRLREHQHDAGIYCWVMSHKALRFCIYIGQATGLLRRLKDYFRRFQVRATDDFKLQIFKEFMNKLAPSTTLDLYFAEENANALSIAERKAIKRYNPFLYKLPKPTEEEWSKLKEAFSLYYRSALARKLKK